MDFVNLMRLAMYQGELKEALAFAESALRQNPENFGLYLDQAQILGKLGQVRTERKKTKNKKNTAKG